MRTQSTTPIRHGHARALMLTGILSLSLISGAAIAQEYSLSSGGMSAEQIAAGQEQYMSSCAGCHGADLRSTDSNAPDLRGPTFQYGWTTGPLAGKFSKIKATMPPGRGGSLTDEAYTNIVAFILSVNGIEPTEGEELPADAAALEHITIVSN